MSPSAVEVNGDSPAPTSSPSSAFLSHLASYPLISDSIQTIQSNPYGSKTIHLSQQTYTRLTKPIIPYLQKPYTYISPYVSRVDSLGDSTLSSIDSKFPIVKKPTEEIYNDGKSLVFFPLTKGKEGKEYVVKTFDGEVKKVAGSAGGEGGKVGVVGKGKAVVSTGLVVTSDALKWLGEWLGEKKGEVKEAVADKAPNGDSSDVKGGEKWW